MPAVSRLLLYTDAPEWGGAEAVLSEVCALLPDDWEIFVAGVTPDIVARIAGDRGSAVDLPPVTGKFDLGPVLAHIRVLRALRPDVVHINLRHPYSAQYGLAVAELLRLKVVAVEHYAVAASSRFQLWAKRCTTARLAAHAAAGEQAARDVERFVGLAAGSVSVLPNGVRDVVVQPALRGSAPLVVVVARLDAVKRLDVAVRAVAQLPGVELRVVGAGPELPALEALVAELGVGDRVHLVGFDAEARRHLAAADVVLATSTQETASLVLAEAALAGRCVVATDIAGHREVMGDTADYVAVGDVDATAAALRELLDDLPRRTATGARARERALVERTSTAMVTRYDAFYRSVLRLP